MTMFGYPRRVQPTRRATPTVTLFDPSADSYCTGWWRSDSNVQLSNTLHQLASGWTSKLSTQRILTFSPNVPWLYIQNSSYGWPAILGTYQSQWNAQNLFQNGDREMTVTAVFRNAYWYDGRYYFIQVDNAMSMFAYDGWLRPYHPTIGYWDLWNKNGVYGFTGANKVSFLTMRMKPYDPTAGDNRGSYRVNFSNDVSGWFTEPVGTSGDRALATTTTLRIFQWISSPILWHEVICWRRCLSDTEVSSMHQLLQQQYGVAV